MSRVNRTPNQFFRSNKFCLVFCLTKLFQQIWLVSQVISGWCNFNLWTRVCVSNLLHFLIEWTKICRSSVTCDHKMCKSTKFESFSSSYCLFLVVPDDLRFIPSLAATICCHHSAACLHILSRLRSLSLSACFLIFSSFIFSPTSFVSNVFVAISSLVRLVSCFSSSFSCSSAGFTARRPLRPCHPRQSWPSLVTHFIAMVAAFTANHSSPCLLCLFPSFALVTIYHLHTLACRVDHRHRPRSSVSSSVRRMGCSHSPSWSPLLDTLFRSRVDQQSKNTSSSPITLPLHQFSGIFLFHLYRTIELAKKAMSNAHR